MKLLVGRIIRGILRRIAVEVRSSVRSSESRDRDSLKDPVVVALLLRLHAHPDVDAITLSSNWWGGVTVLVETVEDDLEYHGDEIVDALALALSDLWGVDD